jgi:GxxExxY protein
MHQINQSSDKTIVNENYKYSALTAKIIGCALEVHRALGNGFQEVVYQRSLEIEMSRQLLSFSREFEMPVMYKGEPVGTRRVDFLVDGKISVELKAIIKLEDVHYAQAINYLEAYNLEVGLLINFGSTKIEFHRLENKKFRLTSTSVR